MELRVRLNQSRLRLMLLLLLLLLCHYQYLLCYSDLTSHHQLVGTACDK